MPIMHVVKTVLIVLEVLLLFNLLIFVHELGHFLAARWRGLKVERFAVWFGKPIWKMKYNGVEYCLGTIPAGGYVSLPQMAPMDLIEGKGEDGEKKEPLPPISPMDKIIVAFAGPLFSFLLAVVFALVVWVVGKPVDADKTTTIGWVDMNGPAWNAGLRPGDKILEVDNKPVSQFAPPAQDSVTWRIIASEGTNIPIKYVRNGEEKMAYPVPKRRETKWYERKAMRQVLIAPEHEAFVHDVATNSPAAIAGLQRGDKVVAVNGEKLHSVLKILHLEESMTNASIAAQPVTLTVVRGSNQFDKTLLAEKPIKPKDGTPSLGVLAWLTSTNATRMDHPSPGAQIESSVSQIVGTLRVLVSRKSDVGVQQLGGAVMIIRVYKNLFENENGWRLVLWFSVIMNVNLALLNLLPLPVLDGGHITLALIEMARRRPVSGKILNYIQSGFAMALIAFMIFIAFFDTGDWVRSARKEAREEQIPVFAPKK
jgi:regulator of sigma E protease